MAGSTPTSRLIGIATGIDGPRARPISPGAQVVSNPNSVTAGSERASLSVIEIVASCSHAWAMSTGAPASTAPWTIPRSTAPVPSIALAIAHPSTGNGASKAGIAEVGALAAGPGDPGGVDRSLGGAVASLGTREAGKVVGRGAAQPMATAASIVTASSERASTSLTSPAGTPPDRDAQADRVKSKVAAHGDRLRLVAAGVNGPDSRCASMSPA
jgi:hypothetical protein